VGAFKIGEVMMYSEKLAIAVKVNGKVLRERGDQVFLPFGSEFSLFIKNLHSRRCLVTIEIDGKDIADGDQFVVPAHGSIEIERFLKNGNKLAGNRFKFIERTAKIEEGPRGIGVEDGLIRVQYEFEREQVPVKQYYPVWEPIKPWPQPPYYIGSPMVWSSSTPGQVMPLSGGASLTTTSGGGSGLCGAEMGRSIGSSEINCSASLGTTPTSATFGGVQQNYDSHTGENLERSRSKGAQTYSFVAQPDAAPLPPLNDAGITVAGSISDQKFHDAAWFPTDGVKHVMVLKLLGEIGQEKVKAPVTVKAKQKCSTCGHVNKASSKFCVECGTSLELVERERVRG
jgi:hypothetical protein